MQSVNNMKVFIIALAIFILFSNACFAVMRSNNYQIQDDTINIGEGERVSNRLAAGLFGKDYNGIEENTLLKIVIFVGILTILGIIWALIRQKIKKIKA